MRSVYGKECAKHPELAGRRYLPTYACIKCHNEASKIYRAKSKSILAELIAAAQESRQLSPRLDSALLAMGK